MAVVAIAATKARIKTFLRRFSTLLSKKQTLSGFGLFDEGFLADDDDDAGIADVEAAAVGFEVVADLSALGKADVGINDGGAGTREGAAVYEIVGKDGVLGNDGRKNVLAEIVAGLGIFGIREEDGNQELCIKYVDPHRSIAVARVIRRLFRNGRLFLEADDAPIFVGLNYTELLGGLGGGYFDGPDGDVGAGVAVLLKHAAVIHFIDVIAREDEDGFGGLACGRIDVLVDGVGGALIPLLRDAHLRREDFDVIAEAGEGGPARTDVAVEAESFVLGEDENAAEIRIDAIGERDVDNAVESAERNGRLGAVASKRPEAFALAPGKEYYDGIPHVGHWLPPRHG